MTHSPSDPMVWVMRPAVPADDGLFYVRWWGAGSTLPAENEFKSRAKALEAMNDLYRHAPYVRIEMLEATEWGTRSPKPRPDQR